MTESQKQNLECINLFSKQNMNDCVNWLNSKFNEAQCMQKIKYINRNYLSSI